MNDIVSTIKLLPVNGAQKLADMYLPVRLRDFYLTVHPVVQAYLYSTASCGEEFFALVDMEYARFNNKVPVSNWKRRKFEEESGIQLQQLSIDMFSERLKLTTS